MLTLILGKMGSGKTLLLSFIGSKITDKKIYSNFTLKLKNYVELKAYNLIKLPSNIEVFLDEGYTWLESRVSARDLNRYLSYMLFQSRKKDTNYYITAQMLSSIDKRFKQMADYLILCERKGSMDNPKGFKYDVIDINNETSFKTFFSIEKAKEIYDIYDTTEVVQPFNTSSMEYNILKDDTQELLKVCQKIAREIKPKIKKITHNNLKLCLLQNGIDKAFEPMVYAILQK